MKKVVYSISIFLCLVFIIIFSIKTIRIESEKVLYYDTFKEKFVFINSDNENLLLDFEDLMPGDTREKTVIVKTGFINSDADVYYKMDFDERYIDIFSNLMLKVYINDKLFSSDFINQGKTSYIKLFNLNDNNNVKLKFVLYVPESVGNEVSNLKTNANICFKVQQNNRDVLVSLDNNSYIFNIIILIVCFIIMLINILLLKKALYKELNEETNK